MTEQSDASPVEHVARFDDPRLDDYRNLKDNLLQVNSGRFVAESLPVVTQLLQSNLDIASMMMTAPRWERLAATPAFAQRRTKPPTYLVEQSVMDDVAGFSVHRGCLAIGVRPRAPTFPAAARLVVALEDLVDVDNVGGVVRNACAFGADGLLLSPKSADPYYRKAIRVAMGNTFRIPIVRAAKWPDDLVALRQRLDARIIGAVVQEDGATPLQNHRAQTNHPWILLLGAEGPGLTTSARQICDELVTIPMANADSLNVATAAAVFLFALTQAARV